MDESQSTHYQLKKKKLYDYNKKTTKYYFNMQIGHYKIECSNKVQYLGVVMDEKMTWKEHVNHLNTKLAKGSWALSKFKSYVSLNTLRTWVTSSISPLVRLGLNLVRVQISY